MNEESRSAKIARHIALAVLFLLIAIIVVPGSMHAQISVLSATVEEKVASPGSRYTASIVISNPSSQAQSARIYQTDYTFSADGKSNFDEPGTTARSNARWVAPQTTRLTIPAGARVTVPYAVIVPAGDSLRGTYWSTVMVEGLSGNPAAANGTDPQLAIGAVMRYAIQVATHIDATGERAVRFDAPTASSTSSGAAALDLDVINTGERAFRPAVWVEVFDGTGKLRAKAKQQRGLLYPGTSLHQRFELGSLPSGDYKAIVYTDTGAEPVFATQYTISW